MDVKPNKNERASDGANRSTDMLKHLIEHRCQHETLTFEPKLQAILIFKSICHHLDITQHHMAPRGPKFKAIALSYWAVAVCDNAGDMPFQEDIYYLCNVFDFLIGHA